MKKVRVQEGTTGRVKALLGSMAKVPHRSTEVSIHEYMGKLSDFENEEQRAPKEEFDRLVTKFAGKMDHYLLQCTNEVRLALDKKTADPAYKLSAAECEKLLQCVHSRIRDWHTVGAESFATG